MCGPPRHLQQLVVQIGAEWSAAAQDAGHEPTRADLAARLGQAAVDIALAQRASQNYRTASLDDESRPVHLAPTVDAELRRCESRLLVERLLPRLDESERRLIVWRFWDERTQAEIAQDLGVSQMQVSRLLARALAHVRELYADGDPTLVLPSISGRARRRRSSTAAVCACPEGGVEVTSPGAVPASAA